MYENGWKLSELDYVLKVIKRFIINTKRIQLIISWPICNEPGILPWKCWNKKIIRKNMCFHIFINRCCCCLIMTLIFDVIFHYQSCLIVIFSIDTFSICWPFRSTNISCVCWNWIKISKYLTFVFMQMNTFY